MRFRILGNGNFGVALSHIFRKNMIIENSMQESFIPFEESDILIPAVPSDAVLSVVKKASEFGEFKAVMVVSKGLSSDCLITSELDIFSVPVLFFAGPNFASEINETNDFLSATIAGPYYITSYIKEFLNDMIIDETTCVIFPQVASILKNIVAFVIGFLQTTENARASLIMQGMQECFELSKFLGSYEGCFCRACISDFILTCTSLKSRNYKTGFNLRNNIWNIDQTVESVKSIHHVMKIKKGLNLPIVDFANYLITSNGILKDYEANYDNFYQSIIKQPNLQKKQS